MCRKRFKSRALKKSHSLKKELGFFSCWHYNRSMGKEDSEMLKDHSQLKRSLSPYQEIYDAIIPANYLLRKIKENVDFKPWLAALRQIWHINFFAPGTGSKNYQSQPSHKIQENPHYRRYSGRAVKGNDSVDFGSRSDKIRKHYRRFYPYKRICLCEIPYTDFAGYE